ncbi:UbiA prenyltransferase family protein [Aestuariivivens insulae]|uniref:hypothetical protein n=1 Tax=Aestuariivivens insulae TaxID=1621988 RepID=UPI001F5A5E37|nr:hypothetical protein [Aestuariivivens insulae]
MKLLKQLVNFYINSSIHVALSVISLTYITVLDYDISIDFAMLMFVLFSSITGYNFVKFYGLAKFHHRSLANWLKTIQVFSFFCFLLMCYYALQLSVRTLLYIAGFALVTFLYAIPFLPKRFFLDSKHNLRSIGGLKVYVIALVWTGVTVFLPLVDVDFSINSDVILTGVQRFIYIVVLMLPFEIRDLRYDSLKLSTIPQKIGVRRTKQVGGILLIVFFLLEFFKSEINLCQTLVMFAVALITLLLVVFSKTEQGKYYSGFWVEGLPIFWLLFLLACC